jgi:hypothetical protein
MQGWVQREQAKLASLHPRLEPPVLQQMAP